MDTIFALATAPGRAGVAIVRMSGPRSEEVAVEVAGVCPKPNVAALRKLRDQDGALIDEGLVLFFRKGSSFTGEDVVEFQTHGSQAVVNRLLRRLSGFESCRHAEAGEFTHRAFTNNRMDLAQVESLADLIEAETEIQRIQAFKGFSGALGKLVERWREELLKAASLLEITIDFSDQDISDDVLPEIAAAIKTVLGEIEDQLNGIPVAQRIRLGFVVAIVGPPNAGKSTLLNYLARREVAITSDLPGTTRDTIEVQLNVQGIPVTFVDTAGLRESDDQIEKIGVDRAVKAAEEADIRVFLSEGLDGWVGSAKKCDLVLSGKDDDGHLGGISGRTGFGVDKMLSHISSVLGGRVAKARVASLERHSVALSDAHSHLTLGFDRLESAGELPEIAAEEVRTAVRKLESLVGRIDVEHMLGQIFSRFCIGK